LSCHFMILKRSAGPCMISSFEHSPFSCQQEVCICAFPKPAIYSDLQRRCMLWRSACQHIWIIVMCRIGAEVWFIHTDCLSLRPCWLSHVSHVLLCMRWVWCLYASACIGTTHVHAHIEVLHVYAGIPTLACFCMHLIVSRAGLASAFVDFTEGKCVS
jgi:hypothetical protein